MQNARINAIIYLFNMHLNKYKRVYESYDKHVVCVCVYVYV